jgi:hypothetical protein
MLDLSAANFAKSPKKQDAHRSPPQIRKPCLLKRGIILSELAIRNEAIAAAPTSSQVENFSIGSIAQAAASNIEETMAFSVFSRASRFHSRRG